LTLRIPTTADQLAGPLNERSALAYPVSLIQQLGVNPFDRFLNSFFTKNRQIQPKVKAMADGLPSVEYPSLSGQARLEKRQI